MHGIVAADIYGVGQSTLGIGEVRVVPESVDLLTTHVAVAEEEAVEGIQACFTTCSAPLMHGLAFVCLILRTLEITSVARRFLGKWELEDSVAIVHHLVVTLIYEGLHIVRIERVLALCDDRVSIVACYLVVFQIVVRALHGAVALGIALVRTERIATCRESDT